MSDGEKKPGLKDISSLKARLGMLSKAKPRPAAPAPRQSVASPIAQTSAAAPIDLSSGHDVQLGNDTAIVRIAPRAAAEDSTKATPFDPMAFAPQAQGNPFAPSPSRPPSPSRAPSPSRTPSPSRASGPSPAPGPSPAGSPGGFDLSEPLFAARAPAPQPAAQQPRSEGQKAADRVSAEAMFAAQAAAEAPPAPQVDVGFAHPLQRGVYVDASAPIDLSALEEDALASFEGQQRGMKTSLAITMTVVVAMLTLFFGFFIGDVRSSRRLVNAQIDASMRVNELMQAPLKQLGEVEKYIEAMAKNPTQVNWAAIAAIPKQMDGVSPSVVASPVPLSKELSGMVGAAAVDLNTLYSALLEHKNITQRRKPEIEALSKGEGFFTNEQFAVYADPPADPTKPRPASAGPPRGRVVALMGKPVKDDKDEYIMPVRYRTANDDKNVLLRGITLVPKSDLQASGTSNVLKLYQRRVESLLAQVKRIKNYEATLRDLLQQQAAREKVMSF